MNQYRLHIILFVAAAVMACGAEATDATMWTKKFIPYNGGEEEMGESGPYTKTDSSRQYLHLFQNTKLQPSPVFIFSHEDGARSDMTDTQMSTIASQGFSIISWESITTVSPGNLNTCQNDFDLVWKWLMDNAATYNLYPNTVVIGGRSRGTLCSWKMAHSQKPQIKGIYMHNSLPDTAWKEGYKKGEDYIWEQAVTVNSPPAYFTFGPECPKPITNDCVPVPKLKSNPKNGQKIVDLYYKLGIGDRIQLTDGLTNNGIGQYKFFPKFVKPLLGIPIENSSYSSTPALKDSEGKKESDNSSTTASDSSTPTLKDSEGKKESDNSSTTASDSSTPALKKSEGKESDNSSSASTTFALPGSAAEEEYASHSSTPASKNSEGKKSDNSSSASTIFALPGSVAYEEYSSHSSKSPSKNSEVKESSLRASSGSLSGASGTDSATSEKIQIASDVPLPLPSWSDYSDYDKMMIGVGVLTAVLFFYVVCTGSEDSKESGKKPGMDASDHEQCEKLL